MSIESVPPNLFAVPDLSSDHPHPQLDVFLQPYWSPQIAHELITTANALVHPRGKGIYATEEAPDAIQALFDGVPVNDREGKASSEESNRERRKRWREFAYNAISSGTLSVSRISCVLSTHGMLQNTSLASSFTQRP